MRCDRPLWQAEAAKQAKKEEERRKLEAKRRDKLEKGKVAPSQLFKVGEYAGKFSQYDEQGIPTHEADGTEISKKRSKKFEADFATQVQLHADYLAAVATGELAA